MFNPALRVQLLRKLWSCLNASETFILTSLERIQEGDVSMGDVRRDELMQLLALESQLQERRTAIGLGVNDVNKSSALDTAQESKPQIDMGVALYHARLNEDYQLLERSLRLQKLIMLTERMIQNLDVSVVESEAIDLRWMSCWKFHAARSSNGGMQQLWARALVSELCRKGSCSLRTLDFMANMEVDIADKIHRVAAWAFGSFVYRTPLQALPYYQHEDMELLEELGILRGVYGKVYSKRLVSSESAYFFKTLRIGQHELTFSSKIPRTELSIPAFKVTALGEELMELMTIETDMLYLDKVAQDLQGRGFDFQIKRTSDSPVKRAQ